jgi:YidC/Oxa1 family membrane protein insertase
MLDPIYEAFGSALAFFYAIVPNLGVAIIFLTIGVMLLLFPLTAKSARSMLAMQRLQPEIKKLQAKHKGDRQKLNEEMMKLYQEHKVNPLGGCLPLLLQMPVFFALFNVLRDPLDWVPTGSALRTALLEAQPDGLDFLGMDLTVKATDSHGGFAEALPYYLLVGLVVLTGFIQSRQTARNTPPGANQQMLIIGKVLPVFFGLISLNFPSGLVLYFFVSNLWRVGQQELIMRKIAPRDHILAARATKKPGAIDVKGTEVKQQGEGKGAPAKSGRGQAEPVAKAAPEEAVAEEAVAEEEGAAPDERPRPLGGLRSLFRPPPAPANGESEAPSPPPKPASTKPASTQSRSGGQQRQNPRSSRAGQSRAQRRRSSNKKRKR